MVCMENSGQIVSVFKKLVKVLILNPKIILKLSSDLEKKNLKFMSCLGQGK